jgi:signal transduction histidine kinase/Flp pilus assembly protein TadD
VLLIFYCWFYPTAAQTNLQLSKLIEQADEIKNDYESIAKTKEIIKKNSLSPENDVAANANLVFRLSMVRNFNDAIKLCYENINKARKQNNDSSESVFLKLLATNFYFMERKDQAVPLFKQSLAIAEKHQYKKLIFNNCSNLGGLLIELREFENAETTLLKALTVADEIDIPNDKRFTTLRLLGTLYENIGKIKEAKKLYEELIEKCISENDSLSKSYVQTFYAGLLNRQGQSEQALVIINKAIPFLKNQSEKKALLAGLQTKHSILKKLNDLPELVKIDSEIIKIQENIFTTDLNKEISETEVKYKTAEIAHQKELSEIHLRNQLKIYVFLFVGILILCLFIFIFIHQQRKAKQKSLLHKEKLSSIIIGEEKERNRIANELHDGVGQMVSAAKMNLSALENDIKFVNPSQKNDYLNIIDLIDDSCKEIRNISHNMAPQAILKSGLSKALSSLIQNTDQRVLKINLYTEGMELYKDIHTESILYRIIQECISNIIKHASASIIDISLIKDKDGISISIEDNGIGFELSNLKNKEGIGLQNIRNRIEYLNGTVEWDTQKGKGTLVAMFIPFK